MKCNVAEKYLYLFRENELSESEKSKLADHLKICSACRILSEKISEFENDLNDLRISEPKLTNSEELTDNIMKNLPVTGIKSIHSSVSFFNVPAVRVAASVFIILQLALFGYQRQYISNSLLSLEAGSQTDKSLIDTRENLNTACIEETRTILSDIFNDEEIPVRQGALAITKNLSPREIELYAVRICAYSYDIQKIADKKKKIIFLSNLINNELPLKF